MNKLIITLLFTILSTNSFASIQVECLGNSKNEVLKFSINKIDDIELNYVSRDLTAHFTSIEEGDDTAQLHKDNKFRSSEFEKFEYWDGNVGYSIIMPNQISQTDVDSGDQFTIKYHFIYSDIEEADFTKKLNCTIQ